MCALADHDFSPRPPLLAGKRAIVTGAWGGIGSGIVGGFRAEGAVVAGIGRSAPMAEGPAADLGLEAVVIADLAEREEIARAVGEAVHALGGLDVLVTAHGHVRPESSAVVDVEEWDLTLATNLSSCFQLSQLAFVEMQRRGAGKIVHVASMYAFFGGLGVAAYAASKGGPRPAREEPLARVGPTRDQRQRYRPWLRAHRAEPPHLGRPRARRSGGRADPREPMGRARRSRRPDRLSVLGDVGLRARSRATGRRRLPRPMTRRIRVHATPTNHDVPDLRIGVDSFAYHRWFGELSRWEETASARWTLDDVIDEAVRVGAEVLSIQTIHLPDRAPGTLSRVRERLGDVGIEPILAWGHRRGLEDGCNPSKLTDALEAVENAGELGCAVMRVVCGDQSSWSPDVAVRASRIEALRGPLTAIGSAGVRNGVLVAVENHADGPVAELSELVTKIDCDYIGLCFDAGNAARVGEDSVAAAHAAAPQCLMSHLRDLRLLPESRGEPSHWWPCVGLGDGDLDIPSVLDALAQAPRCRAWLIETSNVFPGYDEREIVEAGIAYLKAARARACAACPEP